MAREERFTLLSLLTERGCEEEVSFGFNFDLFVLVSFLLTEQELWLTTSIIDT